MEKKGDNMIGENSPVLAIESLTYTRMVVMPSDPNSVPFVAKVQKAKTRKNKNYFVLRATIPKEASEKIGAKAGDYLFFKAKKAEWYHMLDWSQMGTTFQMLPNEVRNRLIVDGLYGQGLSCQPNSLAATNVWAPQLSSIQSNHVGGP
jgi:hypothetical protein